MDAQSVERERLRNEYEKESHGTHGKSTHLPMREVEKAKDKPSLDGHSHIGSSNRGKREDNGRNGKHGKFKRKDKGKHHKHHHKHRGQLRSSPFVDQQAAGGQTGKIKSAIQKEERQSVNGVRDPLSPPTQPQPLVHQPGPVEGRPGENTRPSLPSDIPWYASQVPTHSSGMQSGMPLPGFPWGQQARQGQDTLPRNPDFYHGSAALSALHGPLVDQSFAASTGPVFAGTAQSKQGSSQPPPLESSPRTVPPGVSLPFPVQGMSVAAGSQKWPAPVYGFPEGIPTQSRQAPPPSTSHIFVSEVIGSSDTHGLGLSDAQSMSGKKPLWAMPRAEPVGADEADHAIQDMEDGAGTLEALRARMKENAEESRVALQREKQARKVSEQRLADLEQLVGTDRKKHVSRFGSPPCHGHYDNKLKHLRQTSHKADGESSKAERQVRSPAINDFSPTYVTTTEGFVKTYEKVYVKPEAREGSAASQPSAKVSARQSLDGAYHSRRTTGQTDKVNDDTRPTSTTGPSFGHFGRPFSHRIDPIEHLLHTIPTALDAFPVDPARIVLMQRTVNAQPGFGIPLTALGDIGVGFGAFSPFGDTLLDEDAYVDNASVKRSAYVETVSDEEVRLFQAKLSVLSTTNMEYGRTRGLQLSSM